MSDKKEDKQQTNNEQKIIELSPEDEERFKLIRSVGEECLLENELRALLKAKKEPICYDGFEPSGRIHIAQGIMKAINVNKLTKAGCRFIFWVADWFALMNNKMGGKLEKIQNVGKYMIEVWKAVGMDMSKVEFLWASEEINKKPNEYWLLVLDIARRFNVARITRCSQIMGRSHKDELSAAQIFYPCMQCADIFFLKADICQLGMDQRKVNMLAREYCDVCQPKRKFKPVILSHHMLLGLKGAKFVKTKDNDDDEEDLNSKFKMSKSDPESAIFMDDSEQDVNLKIKKAFCEPGNIQVNPLLEYVRYIVLPLHGKFEVKRTQENGGDITYTDPDTIEKDFEQQKLHPNDLKPALAKAINKILQPVRDHFKNNPEAAKLAKMVKNYVAEEMKKKKKK